MAARSFKLEDIFYREKMLMKVELTRREIDLILTLINDAVSGDFSMGGSPIYTNEEAEIIKKLEDALRNSGKQDKSDTLLPGHTSETKH